MLILVHLGSVGLLSSALPGPHRLRSISDLYLPTVRWHPDQPNIPLDRGLRTTATTVFSRMRPGADRGAGPVVFARAPRYVFPSYVEGVVVRAKGDRPTDLVEPFIFIGTHRLKDGKFEALPRILRRLGRRAGQRCRSAPVRSGRKCLQRLGEPDERLQRSAHPVDPELLGKPLGECGVRGANPPNGFAAVVGGAHQLGSPVGGIRLVLGEAVSHENVRDPLHALACDADLARDTRHRQRLLEHRREHLPPRRREVDRVGKLFADGEELAI